MRDAKSQDSNSSTLAQDARPRTVAPNPESTPTAPAQDDTAKQIAEAVDDDEVVRVDSNLVLVPASVVDSRGRAITDLKLDDFELRIDGQVQPISDLGRAETPVLIALLFDNSASLSAAREFEKKAATRFFQSVVRPIDRAAVYSISTVPVFAQPLTSNVTRLVNTVEGFPHPEGATALFDTIAQAADYLRPFTGRKVIVLVSDGTDTVSDISFEDALSRVLRADLQFYVVQTRQVEDPNLHDPISEGRLDKLTEQTGGAVYVPRSIEDLDAAFTQISLDIGQQYLLSYYPQDERKDKYFRFINLRVKTRPSLRVRARKGFYPTSAQNQPAPTANGMMTTSRSRDSDGSEFVAAVNRREANNALSNNSGNEASVAPKGIVVSRKQSDGGGTRKIGPADPDENVSANRAAIKTLPIPENPTAPTVTTRENNHSSRVPPKLAPTPSPSSTPAHTKVAETRIDTSPLPVSSSDVKGKSDPLAVSGGVLNSKALNLPKPVYTPAAKNAGVSGMVVVEVTIDRERQGDAGARRVGPSAASEVRGASGPASEILPDATLRRAGHRKRHDQVQFPDAVEQRPSPTPQVTRSPLRRQPAPTLRKGLASALRLLRNLH